MVLLYILSVKYYLEILNVRCIFFRHFYYMSRFFFFLKQLVIFYSAYYITVQNFLIHSEYFNRFRLIKLFCQSNALSLTVNGKNIFGNVTNPLK